VGGPLLPPLLEDELTEITLCGLLLQRLESSAIDTAIEFLNLGAVLAHTHAHRKSNFLILFKIIMISEYVFGNL